MINDVALIEPQCWTVLKNTKIINWQKTDKKQNQKVFAAFWELDLRKKNDFN